MTPQRPASKGRSRQRTTPAKPAPPETRYLVLWWHLQRLYVGIFENETEASLHAAARNGVVVELLGHGITIGAIDDYWRRDDAGKPMPAEWRTERLPVVT